MNTKTYIAMRDMWARGLTVDEIADAVGMTRHAAFAMMKRDRAAFPRRRHHIDWWRRRLAEVERLPSRQAAARLGCSYETVWSFEKFVKTPASNVIPSRRLCFSPIDDASMTIALQPAPIISRIAFWIS